MGKKPQRVLVIRNAYDKDCGGAEQYALNLCVQLKKNNLDPVLMTRVPDLLGKASNEKITTLKGCWHASQKWGKHYFFRFPLMVVWYIYIILRYRFDIIHPQGRDDFIFASIAGGLLGKRVIWTDHADLKYILDLDIHPFPYLRTWTIWASRFVSKIICVSNSEKEKISVNAPDQFIAKLVTVHNGVIREPIYEKISRPTEPLIVANSRLVPDKGIRELIEMIQKLKHHNASLWIVGGFSGNQEMYTNIAKELGVAERVTLWGYVDHPNDYIAAGDVFVHASYHEAFSLAILEAAMLSMPIVATNVGGAPEVISDQSGILVPPKDVYALVNAVDKLLDDPVTAKRLGKRVGEVAQEKFSFDTIVKEKIIPLYS